MKRILQIVGASLLVAGLGGWVGVGPIIATLESASGPRLIVYGLLTMVVLVGHALRWRLVAQAFGMRVPLPHLLSARLAGDAVSTLVPSARIAGEPVRVVLTRGVGATRQSVAAAAVVIDRLMEVIGNVVAVLAYLAIICVARRANAADAGALVTGGATLVAFASLLVLVTVLRSGRPPLRFLYGNAMRRFAPRIAARAYGIRRFEEHLVEFCRDCPRQFAVGVLVALLIEVIVVAQYASLLRAFSVAVDVPTLLLVLLGTGVARAAPMPAGIGALEATQVALVGAVAGQPELGLIVAVILRLHEMLLLGVGLVALGLSGFGFSLKYPIAEQRQAA